MVNANLAGQHHIMPTVGSIKGIPNNWSSEILGNYSMQMFSSIA